MISTSKFEVNWLLIKITCSLVHKMYDITDSRETITSGCKSRNSRLNLREKQKTSTTSGQRKNNTLTNSISHSKSILKSQT